MLARAEAVVEEVGADSAVVEVYGVAEDWVEAEATAPRVAADIVAAVSAVAALVTPRRCLDRPDFHPRLRTIAVADLQVGHPVYVRHMAVCLHQVIGPAQDLVVGGAEQESQLCQAALGQALAFDHRQVFDQAEACFQPVASDLRLATYRVS